jgi:FtsH-binding integral membrane protein
VSKKNKKKTANRTRTRALSPAKRRFLGKVYGHVLAAIFAVIVIEVLLFESGFADRLASRMLATSWLLVLAAFMVVAWLARRAAFRTSSRALQYVGLGLYVVAKSIILVPLLYQAERFAPGALDYAIQFTTIGALGLTAIVLLSGHDFYSLRPFLMWGGFISLIAIIAALLFGWRLGIWFDIGMIALAGASILHDTGKVLKRYRGDRYVAAALELFASIAFMFWYALRMFRRFERG